MMAQILYITANPKPVEKSFSLSLGDKFIKAYQEANPGDEIVSIDLYKSEVPEIDADLLKVFEDLGKGGTLDQQPEQIRSKFQKYNQLTDQFVAADKYIFVTPMWNLGMPPRVKTYIDTVIVVGKTFKYTDKGPVGLLQNKNKKCLHVHASGGAHAGATYNHADPFLKDIMSFIGVGDYRTLLVEGQANFPDKADRILNDAYAKVPEFVKWFS